MTNCHNIFNFIYILYIYKQLIINIIVFSIVKFFKKNTNIGIAIYQ